MRLLVPIDGSALSARAARYAGRAVEHGEIVLFHVTGIPPELLEHEGGTPKQERALEELVREQSARYEQRIRPRIDREVFDPARSQIPLERGSDGVRVRCVLVTEPTTEPALAIAAEAERSRYDAVVIGRHGRSGVMRFYLGGTASKLVHHLTDVPIWLVP